MFDRIDSVVLDRVAQPLADLVARHCWSPFLLARDVFGIAGVVEIMWFMGRFAAGAGPLDYLSSMVGLAVVAWAAHRLTQEERRGGIRWLNPLRVEWWLIRLVWLALTAFCALSTALSLAFGDSLPAGRGWLLLSDLCFCAGFYLGSAQPRPPVRRHAPAGDRLAWGGA